LLPGGETVLALLDGRLADELGEKPTLVPRFELIYQIYESGNIAGFTIKETINGKDTEWEAELPPWEAYGVS